MGWFEWVGEMFSPGDRGGVAIRESGRVERPVWLVVTRLAVTLAVLGGLGYGVFTHVAPLTAENLALLAAPVFAYCLIAYLVRPVPDMDNLGWGLFDDPFQVSDDFNRMLLWLAILLWPGRFIAESLVDAVLLPFDG
jgi:hypothetical protein